MKMKLTSLAPAEAPSIAREAYIYGFPLVDNYRIQHSYFEDKGNPKYKAPWNTLFNNARVYTPEDKAIQTPTPTRPTPTSRKPPQSRLSRRRGSVRAGCGQQTQHFCNQGDDMLPMDLSCYHHGVGAVAMPNIDCLPGAA